ncbi:MAG: type II toxin-antitoxin system VapC family toxin [Thermodesulfobacteriota bacterium]
MNYVLDTHVLLWWTLDPEKLSPAAKEILKNYESNSISISSISIWELGIKQKRKKLDIGMTIEKYTENLKNMGSIKIVPIDEKIWIKNLSLDWDNADPADRTIVATASLSSSIMISKDEKISEFYKNTVW